MSPGTVVWSVIAATVLGWLGASAVVSWIPTPASILRGFVASWAGRIVLAAAWAEVGWHLFCQRP